MKKTEIINKKINREKFLDYGFKKLNGEFVFSKDITDGQLEVVIKLENSEFLLCGVFDKITGDEYVLHLVESANGAFVGQVRDEVDGILTDLISRCFDRYVFKDFRTNGLLEYIAEKYGNLPEFPWDDENAVVRRRDNAKWYAAFLKVKASKLGIDSERLVEIVNLKINPEDVQKTVDFKKCFPAYHMNKKHWISVLPEACDDMDEVQKLVDDSFYLSGNTRK